MTPIWPKATSKRAWLRLVRGTDDRYARPPLLPTRSRRPTRWDPSDPARPQDLFTYERISMHCRCASAPILYAPLRWHAELVDVCGAPIASLISSLKGEHGDEVDDLIAPVAAYRIAAEGALNAAGHLVSARAARPAAAAHIAQDVGLPVGTRHAMRAPPSKRRDGADAAMLGSPSGCAGGLRRRCNSPHKA